MLPVSLDYQAKIKDTVRTVKGRVQIDYTDPFIDQSITATVNGCLLYTSPSPRDRTRSRMPSSA